MSLDSFAHGSQTDDGRSVEAVALKPAIYLYPETEQVVRIQLDSSIQILIDVPRHVPGRGWTVLAHPDGTLNDLQPEATDLSDYDASQLGMEFVHYARETGHYPYIYWDGIQTQQKVPPSEVGWLVTRSEIAAFLSERMVDLQLNVDETAEFLNFWVPLLSQHPDAEGYRIYFLQNQAVQSYLPFAVSPTPQSYNRIFMVVEPIPVWEAVQASIKPQVLQPVIRQGFTLVEWGGTLHYTHISLEIPAETAEHPIDC